MQIERTALPDVVIITPVRHGDARGFFCETWNPRRLLAAGIALPDFVQDNQSVSARAGTLRGLHCQAPPSAQGKLVRCGRGRVWDVAVDVRRGSASYGRHVGVELSAANGRQLWIPPGFLHGFITREEDSELLYKCTAGHDVAAEHAVAWDSLGIDWGCDEPFLSERDRAAPRFADWTSPFE